MKISEAGKLTVTRKLKCCMACGDSGVVYDNLCLGHVQ